MGKPSERGASYVKEEQVNADFRIADLYMGFSSELLRLSLGGIGVLGFLLSEDLVTQEQLVHGDARVLILSSMGLLVLSACAALAHRYFASESMAYQLSVMRTRNVLDAQEDRSGKQRWTAELQEEKDRWHRCLKWSGYFIAAASVTLGIGIVLLGAGSIVAFGS